MALGSTAYVPILKARQAEIKALLKSPAGLEPTPLFELQRAAAASVDRVTGEIRRRKSTATDASYFIDDVARLWDAPLYIDVARVAAPGERGTWWSLLKLINDLAPEPVELMPVLHLDDNPSDTAAAAGIAATTGRAAVRIFMEQVRSTPTVVGGVTTSIAGALGLPATAIDAVLDWGDRTEGFSLDDLESDTVSVINNLGPHGAVITAGTPNSEAFVQVGDWRPLRREWLLWLRLAHAGHSVVFGDYALYPPSDPVPARPQYGHLRYSSGDRLYVHRRAMPSGGGGLAGAFKTCCEHVVSHTHWLGGAFSGADGRIEDITLDADKESSAGGWRQIAAEHHFHLVAEQLTSPPPAPPPGTP